MRSVYRTAADDRSCAPRIVITGPGNGGTPHSSGLRHLLGRAVRLQTDQQRDLDALRDSVSEARVNAWSATQKAAASSTASIEATERGDKLEAELAAERNERMESEAAALEREEELQAKIDELEEKERRRVELQKALDDAEAMEAPAMPAASIAVVAKPPPPPPPGMNMAAGGFEL